MAIKTAIVRQTQRDGTGDQSFTVAGFGTPQLAIFIASTGEVDGIEIDHARMMFGATDGSTQFCGYVRARDAQATSDTIRQLTDSYCIALPSASTGTILSSAAFKEWITDGITVTFDTEAFSNERLITCILISGLDAVSVDLITLSTEDTEVHVNGLGFEPTDLITFGVCHTATTITENALFSFGAVHNGDSVSQVAFCYNNKDASADSLIYNNIRNDCGSLQQNNTGVVDHTVEFTDFDAQGYSAYARGGDGGGDLLGVISIKHSGKSFCGIIDSPTSTGNQAITGIGFKPDFILLGLTGCTAINTVISGDNAGTFGLSVFNGDQEFCEIMVG
jgi:hypothetical protein